MLEQTFFQNGDVHITNTRFVSGNQTFAMSNITSVKSFEDKPSYFLAIVTLVIGVAILASYTAVGMILCAAACFSMFKKETTYHVMLATSGGEVSALKTNQPDYLNQVVAALNSAIISRG